MGPTKLITVLIDVIGAFAAVAFAVAAFLAWRAAVNSPLLSEAADMLSLNPLDTLRKCRSERRTTAL